MKEFFGRTELGEEANIYRIKSGDAYADISDFGATLVRFYVCGRDIVGGYDTLDGYLKDDSHQGGTIGRVANRVEDAEFFMDGVRYSLPDNSGGCCLHGGRGFDRRMWKVTRHTKDKILLEYTAEDGEEGFPARLDVKVCYTLSGGDLRIDYEAMPHGKTPISLTNHTYFNLDGLGGDILNHEVIIDADEYTYLDGRLVAIGGRVAVSGTAHDFTTPHKIGERIGGDFIGYDNNFVLNKTKIFDFSHKKLHFAASAQSGDIRLSVFTDQDGVQFYIGNFLGGEPDFKGGVKRIRHGAFCFETQSEPNSIRRGEGFYDIGDIYRHTCVYRVERV